jgi:hypothetical protein
MENTKSQIFILLQTLSFHMDNWDFESVISTYKILGELDDYYYVDLLVFLADASFLDEMNLLIFEKGTTFFREYLKSSRITETSRTSISIKRILNWHEKVFLCVKFKKDVMHIEEHERIILELIRDKEYSALKSYITANNKEIFKHCRLMVVMYAASCMINASAFTPDMAFMYLGVPRNNLLNTKRIVRYILQHALTSKVFLQDSIINITNVNVLMGKIFNCGNAYGKNTMNLLLKIIDKMVKFVGPVPNDIKLDDWDIWENDYFNTVPTVYKNNVCNVKKTPNIRVAVCISGMTRGNNICIRRIKDNIVDPLNADVFLSTWDIWQVWPGGGIGGGAEFARRLFGKKGHELLPEELNKKSTFSKFFQNTSKIIIGAPQEKLLDIAFYTENIPITSYKIENEEDFLSSTISFKEKLRIGSNEYNQAKMFYKIYSSNQLAIEHEIKNNFKYDFIIRIRPDISCINELTLENIGNILEGEISLSYGPGGPSDQLWIGRRDTIVKLSSLWKYIFFAQQFEIFLNYKFASHRLLLMAMAKMGFTMTKSPITLDLAGATEGVSLDIGRAVAMDFSGPGAIYKDNDSLKAFFRMVAQDPSVC